MKRTRNTLTTLLWIFLGVAVSGLAYWQAQVANEKERREAEKLPAPPTQTHSAGRVPLPPVDAISDFKAKAEKGMTDEQILFIIQDFKDAGLAAMPANKAIEYQQAQQRWYHRILKHWLNLSRDQSDEAAKELSRLLSKLPSDSSRIDPFENVNSFFTVRHLNDYQPWKLCSLTLEQSAITWESWVKHGNFSEALTPLPNQSSKYTSKTHSEATGAPLLSPPPVKLSGRFAWSTLLIPFLEEQQIYDHENQLEIPYFNTKLPNSEDSSRFREFLNRLHPAQLEYILLSDPDIAEPLRQLIEKE